MNESSERIMADPKRTASVRVLPGGYLAALLVLTFLSSLLAYIELPIAAVALAVAAWTMTPVLWFTDRVVFDGRRIARTGIVFRLIANALGIRDRLKLNDIEQVETAVFPGIKRGKNILYTYRTSVSGKTAHFVFSSGHRGYHSLIRAFLPRLPEGVMDLT